MRALRSVIERLTTLRPAPVFYKRIGNEMSMDTLAGGCLCGAVRYRTGLPTLPATTCHCRSCRLAAGVDGACRPVGQAHG
jgi:hypothetical protein